MLNLPPRPRADGDRPLWEDPEDLPTEVGAPRPVAGRLQWWTWPSRTLRLRPDARGRITEFAWHDGPRAEGGTVPAARAHDPLTAWRGPTSPLRLPDEHHTVPAWAAARTLTADSAVIAHATHAAEQGLIPSDYPLRVNTAWTEYNDHKSNLTAEGAGDAALGPARLLADPAARTWLVAAAHAAHTVPAAIRTIAAGREDCGYRPLKAPGPLALDCLRRPWHDLLDALAADPSTAEDAVRAWRATLHRAAGDAFDRHVHGRPQDPYDKILARHSLTAYLNAIPLGGEPPAPDATTTTPREQPERGKKAQKEPARERPAATTPDMPGPRRPRGRPPQLYRAFGEAKSITDWAADPRCTVAAPTLRQRLGNGETPESALTRPSQRTPAPS